MPFAPQIRAISRLGASEVASAWRQLMRIRGGRFENGTAIDRCLITTSTTLTELSFADAGADKRTANSTMAGASGDFRLCAARI